MPIGTRGSPLARSKHVTKPASPTEARTTATLIYFLRLTICIELSCVMLSYTRQWSLGVLGGHWVCSAPLPVLLRVPCGTGRPDSLGPLGVTGDPPRLCSAISGISSWEPGDGLAPCSS